MIENNVPRSFKSDEYIVDDFIEAASKAADQRAEARAVIERTEDISAVPKKTAAATTRQNPIDIFGIDHVVLKVDDLEGMTQWYEKVLGCKVARRNEKFQMVHLDAGSSLIDLVDKAGPLGGGDTKNKDCGGTMNRTQQKMDHLCLGLNNFDEDAIREHLLLHGVTIVMELGVRYGKGGFGESLYFEDPEGNRIEIKKSQYTSVA